MNLAHRWLCRSALWRGVLEQDIFPWALDGVALGEHLLELGPGPGVTTDLLQRRAGHLTVVEIDFRFASHLARRFRNTRTRIVQGDATLLPFGDSTFTSVASFSMLHHLPWPALQDRLFCEVRRVLVPGGAFAGTDGLNSVAMRLVHLADTFTPIDPATLPARLEEAGFQDVAVGTKPGRFRFRAVAGGPLTSRDMRPRARVPRRSQA
ncbi:MAG TPA: class I SAM-dependent methyltransferase [Bryobacteraceae bacterium]|nr:class I SAM-dependent methyltransferase [Bryobacteraceae bacterium]